MTSKIKYGVTIFICVCLGFIAYTQFDKYITDKKNEAGIKTQNEQIIKSIENHQKQDNPLTNRQKGTL